MVPRRAYGRRGLEDGFEASFGEWDVTTDQMTDDCSSANVAVRDGALVVTAGVDPGGDPAGRFPGEQAGSLCRACA